MSEFPEATSFLVLCSFSWKFRSSWFCSAATSFLLLSSNIASLCHTWELDAASWLFSLATSLPVLFQSSWQGALTVSGLFDAIGLYTVKELVGACQTRFNVGFDCATILSSPFSSCIRFAIVSGQLAEFWELQSKLKWLILNKHNRWFHSSRVKFPLVSMSASWFLVSMYLIWICGSKLIRSKNQSSATLWVLETCLIVGLLPFMIILITASLFSNTCNKASWCENWTFEGTQSMLFRTLNIPRDCPCTWPSSRQTTGFTVLSWFSVVSPRAKTIRSHQSRAGIESNLNPASKEMISDSVELCETDVCFLHIQLGRTNVWLPNMHKSPPEVDFESSRSAAKSESWNSPNLHCCAVFSTSQYCLNSLVWWM